MLNVKNTVLLLTFTISQQASAGSLGGTVWRDTDGDGVIDFSEERLQGWTLFIDDNENGALDSNERSTLSDSSGNYRFNDLLPGRYSINQVQEASFQQTFPTEVTEPGNFSIDLVYIDNNLNTTERSIARAAADRWEEIVTGDQPDATLPSFGFIDDLVIRIAATSIDGADGIIGQATVDNIRASNGTTLTGTIEMDQADLNSLQQLGLLDDVFRHEMGHVLGIGSRWSGRNLVSGTGTSNPVYTGNLGVLAYRQIFNNQANSVPVANEGGPGSVGVHWRESLFQSELMTSNINFGLNPLSRLTAQSLADLGYTVNVNAADSYTAPSGRGNESFRHTCHVQKTPPNVVDDRSFRQQGKSPSRGLATPIPHVVRLGENETILQLNFGNQNAPVVTPIPTPVPTCTENLLGDESLESPGNSPWVETSIVFASPRCDHSCLIGGARTGDFFYWFGGTTQVEFATASQTIVIPSGLAELRFWLSIHSASGSFDDTLKVFMDDEEFIRFTRADVSTFGSGYQQVTLDISSYADGASHTLRFEAAIDGTQGTNSFFIDDIQICPQSFTPTTPPPTFGPSQVDGFFVE